MRGPRTAALPRLLVLTDRSQLRLGRGLVQTVVECVDAGLTHVMVREHDLAPAARTALVAALADVPGLTVISSRVADRRAHGLHQPAAPGSNAGLWSLEYPYNGCEVTITPRYTRVGALLGRSCHTRDEVRRAERDGVDYVTLSPYAASVSKPGYGPALAPGACAGHPLPVLALGGITPANAGRARADGAFGVAVMGTVMRAADPAEVVAALLEAAA